MSGNGTTNGHSPRSYLDWQEQARALRAAQAELLESYPALAFDAGWGSLVNPAWSGWGSDPRFGLAYGAGWIWGHGRTDRAGGANRPFVWTEFDLDRQRSLARWLATENDHAKGILRTIRNYAVRTGYHWEAKPAKGLARDPQAAECAKRVQALVDDFGDKNELADREGEAVVLAVRDGECMDRFFARPDGTTVIRPVYPEQVFAPEDAPPHCLFGVETDPEDVEALEAYWVSYDGGTTHQRVAADEMCHLKRNVDRCVKRGLSDFFSSAEALQGVEKLLRHMLIVGPVQAAIPWIEQFEQASQAAISALISGRRDLNIPAFTNPVTGRELASEQVVPGKVPLVGKGREYVPQPSAGNVPNHVQLIQAALRSCAQGCWGMPEYMVSADASNANYASTLVSGSPFVVAVECEQQRFGRYFRRWRWQAVKNACAAGLLPWRFEDVERLVDIEFTPPQVAIANEGEEAGIDSQDIQNKVISRAERQRRRGVDPDLMRQEIAREAREDQAQKTPPEAPGGFGPAPPSAPPEGGPPGGGGGGGLFPEGVQKNKSGPGCHDTQTGHPAPCPGAEQGGQAGATPAAPAPTGHPAIDSALAAAGTPGERVVALYDSARGFGLLHLAGEHDAAALDAKIDQALAGATEADLKKIARNLPVAGVPAAKLPAAARKAIHDRVGATIRGAMIHSPADVKAEAQAELAKAGYRRPAPVPEGVQPNKSGPGCHDDKTGHPAPCPGAAEQGHERAAARQSPEEAAAEYREKGTRATSFKAWFGDWEADPARASKVADPETGEPKETHSLPDHTSQVGKDGVPVAVFHGTPGQAFGEFRRDKLRHPEALVYGPGFYFSEDRGFAETYAKDEAGNVTGEIMTVYLNIRTPFRVGNTFSPEDYQRITGEKPGLLSKLFGGAKKQYTGNDVYNALVKRHGGRVGAERRLRELGYDGIHTPVLNGQQAPCWVAFEPHQIKSTDNRGTFDPESGKIHEGVARNKTGPGCHDTETGHPVPCPGSEATGSAPTSTAGGLAGVPDRLAAAVAKAKTRSELAGAVKGVIRDARAGLRSQAKQATAAVREKVADLPPGTQHVLGVIVADHLRDFTDELADGLSHDLSYTVGQLRGGESKSQVAAALSSVRDDLSPELLAEKFAVDARAMKDALAQTLGSAGHLSSGDASTRAGEIVAAVAAAMGVRGKPLGEGVQRNRTGPGCHDDKTGHRAECPGGKDAGGAKVRGAAADPARHTAAEIWGKEPTPEQRAWHRAHVEDALARGEDVPAAVRAEVGLGAAVRPAALADAYEGLAASGGGVVKVPDLFDALSDSHPGLTPGQFHAELSRLQADDRLTLQVVNDPHLEPRSAEMPRDAEGAVRGYVLIRPQQLQALLGG